ncbi:MarR family winged helix-turn-helix transcriptional regulator [Williamsia sp.]|uniref:MarR family winged helix-turn-helix transcriptional regulator n=1 Tax=Williamsia sp. TaxID=1872085 RepID=UPI0025E21136|nr:MarR family winged helix-turn-helix transcriptional regulator [Williamsia sp.]
MHYRVLSAVQVRGNGFNQRDVADMLGTTSATVSRQIESATNEGHLTVEVSTTSRRENNVRLTATGIDLVARGDAIIAEESEMILAGVDRADFTVAADTVQTMLDTITRT